MLNKVFLDFPILIFSWFLYIFNLNYFTVLNLKSFLIFIMRPAFFSKP